MDVLKIAIKVKHEESYRYADYFLGDDESKFYEQTPYIYKALESFYNIDKTIIIGTAGSDWYALYEYICREKG